MVLTPYFTTHEDWQRGHRVPASQGKIRALLDSTARLGLCATVVYDSLPDSLIKQASGDRVHFQRVDLKEFNPRLATTDSRFLVYEKLLLAHPEWRRAFMVDAFDVTAATDPFPHMKDGALYIGSDAGPIRDNAFMRERFLEMGGKYLRWFLNVPAGAPILNAGVIGGGRAELLSLLGKMREVFTDKGLAAWTSRGEVHVDMGAFNYAVYTSFARNFTLGAPVSSRFKGYERNRKDVWFIHKL